MSLHDIALVCWYCLQSDSTIHVDDYW